MNSTEGGMPSLEPLGRYVKRKKETEQYESIPHENGIPTITLKAYPGTSESFKDDMKEVVDQVGQTNAN
ncbi:hypothetical protein ACEQPO_13850 [Bacillus sp. SL00103]